MNGEKSELIRIGETIYKLRKSRKMSQKELAEKAEISDVTLQDRKRGCIHEYSDPCKACKSPFCDGRRDF